MPARPTGRAVCPALVVLVALSALTGAAWPTPPAARDAASGAAGLAVVTPQFIGNPFTDKPVFSRNVWDMQVFGSRIYLGHGDWGDNTGPIPIRYIDTPTQQLLTDPILNAANTDCPTGNGLSYCVDDEEIESYRVIAGKLYLPGIDAKDAVDQFSFGNFYTRDAADGAWVKHRTVPGAVHVFDLYLFADPLSPASLPKLFAGTGTIETSSPMVSDDAGQTVAGWHNSTFNGGPGQTNRVYRLFALAGRLYGSSLYSVGHQLLRYEGGVDFSQVPYSAANRMFPDRLDANGNASSVLRVFRESYFGSQMLYLGVSGDAAIPFGLYKATDVTQAQAIALPVAGVRPMDLLRGADGQAYVLGQTGAAGSYTNYVFTSADLTTWSEVLRFAAPSFARSFEYLDGDFYFGLGTTRSELSSAAGNLLRARNPLLPPPTATPTLTPTRTRTATPTAISSPSAAPTSAATTGPPRVAVTVQPAGAGRLAVVITARPATCAAPNTLQELRFGNDPRSYRNAAIEIDGAMRQPPFVVSLPVGTTAKSFAVVQLVPGQDATVPVIARDSCGEWTTLVGGGAAAFQGAAPLTDSRWPTAVPSLARPGGSR